MTNFIPIFPLNIIVFPNEALNLHIFEPRYKQLILECHQSKKPFGVPAVINNSVQEYGSIVELLEISKEYENGELDIKTKGVRVFKILEIINELPDKLYSGAIVNYPANNETTNRAAMQKILFAVGELHNYLQVDKDFKKASDKITVYDIAHHIGLSVEEEYELLKLMEERQRIEYVKRHLAKVIPMLADMEKLKEKIKLNGHFKNLSGLDL